MPELTWKCRTHNPEVAGSNPARATKAKVLVKRGVAGAAPLRRICKPITQRGSTIRGSAKPQVDGHLGSLGWDGVTTQRAPQSCRSGARPRPVQTICKPPAPDPNQIRGNIMCAGPRRADSEAFDEWRHHEPPEAVGEREGNERGGDPVAAETSIILAGRAARTLSANQGGGDRQADEPADHE
jgi:hypothetical protein